MVALGSDASNSCMIPWYVLVTETNLEILLGKNSTINSSRPEPNAGQRSEERRATQGNARRASRTNAAETLVPMVIFTS